MLIQFGSSAMLGRVDWWTANSIFKDYRGPGSSVDIGTDYGLEGPG